MCKRKVKEQVIGRKLEQRWPGRVSSPLCCAGLLLMFLLSGCQSGVTEPIEHARKDEAANTMQDKSSSQDSSEASMPARFPLVIDAAFNGPDEVWLINNKGQLLHTSDSGKTWEDFSQPSLGSLQCLSFIDAQRGWIINEDAQIWRTTDGGRTWALASKLQPAEGDDWRFNMADQLHFVDESNGWVVESFSIWRTTDGGVKWNKCFDISDPGIKGQPVRGAFISAHSAFVCGTDGEIYLTGDGGTSWQTIKLDSNLTFTDIFFINEREGWLSGFANTDKGGRLFHTTDGGQSWQPDAHISGETYIKAMYFINNHGWAVGVNSEVSKEKTIDEGVILQTNDKGHTWRTIHNKENEEAFEYVHFVDAQQGWLFSTKRLYRVVDRGKKWEAVLKNTDDKQ